MSSAARHLLTGVAVLLGVATLIGWLYDAPLAGLAVGALIALGFQLRQLLAFERALRTRDYSRFQLGEGIWQQIMSRFRFERSRAAKHKADYRRLLREIRRSTDAMPDGAVILNADNEIILCNRAAKRLAGIKRHKDRGQRIDNILRDPALSRLVNDDDFNDSIEFPSPLVDGDWLNCRVVPYGAGQKLMLLRDVTERRKLSKMRRDFVANVSHELRSPLTVVNGYLDALVEDERVSADWARPLAQMQAQTQRMNKLLTELLDLARLEGSAEAGRELAVDVRLLLESVRRDFERPGSTPRIYVNAESAARLLGDPGEIESIVVNLVSNAIRHTPTDGVVTLQWRSDDGGAELSVRDTGVGIAADDLPRITERFFRIDRGRARDGGGVGLGLAIVKHALRRHDAELSIVSEPGEGSEFVCRFPLDRLQLPAPVPLS